MKTQKGADHSALTAFKRGKTSSVTYATVIDGRQCTVTITRP